ncbi:hypothetical protein S231_00970 [Candidatus Phytoplasma solani]|nr:hypothetical protein S231_00970 [Candidatus Phytoplasma solani]
MVASDGKTWYLYKNSKDTIKRVHKIEKAYTFYGLTGLRRGHHREHEPTDLVPFMKNPFDKWYDEGIKSDNFIRFYTNHKNKDLQFNNRMIPDLSNHEIEFNYKDPKYLLEEDKDFFMDKVNCISNKRSPKGSLINKTYYLCTSILNKPT